MSGRLVLISAVIGGALLAIVPSARAQSDRDVEQARGLFTEGLEAAQQEQWARAAELFERSYAILPLATTLVNLATAQDRAGHLVESLASLERLVTDEGTELRRMRPQFRQSIAELRRRIPMVVVRAQGLLPSDRVMIDGRPLSPEELETEVPIDPGPRRVAIVRDGRVMSSRAVTLAEGARQVVELDVRLDPSALQIEAEPVEPPCSGCGGDQWIWWTAGISAGLAVVTVILVTIGIVAGQDGRHTGNIGPGVLVFE